MSDETLYARFKHTIGCRIEYAGDDGDGDWFDLDIYSESEDPKSALESYLDEEYGDDAQAKQKAGVYSVADPSFGAGSIVRHYRLK